VIHSFLARGAGRPRYAIAAPAPTIAIIAADADPQGERGIEADKSGSALKLPLMGS